MRISMSSRGWRFCLALAFVAGGGAWLCAGDAPPAKTAPGKTTMTVVQEREGVTVSRMPLETKAKTLVIPKLVAEEQPARKVFADLRRLIKEADPEKDGINIIFRCPPKALDKTITIDVSKMTVFDLTENLCRACNLHCEFEDFAIVITVAEKR